MSIKLRTRQVYFRDQNGNYVPLPAFSAPSEGGGGTGGGVDGYTYTPYVSPEGVISWTNNGGLPNPASVNIKGHAGETGPQGEQGIQGPAGHTPVKGTDYWTTADRQSMVSDVLAALPTWTGGSY